MRIQPFDDQFPISGNLLLDSLDVMVVVFNFQGLRYVNAAVEKILGYSPQTIQEKNILDLVHPDFRADIVRRIQNRLTGDKSPSHYYTQLLKADGDPCWVEINLTATEANGETYFMGTLTEITQRIQVEVEAHEQRMLSKALQQTAHAISTTVEMEKVFPIIMSNMGRIVPSETASIMLLEHGSVARFASSQGFSERGLKEWLQRLRINIEAFPLLQEVAQKQRGILIPDTSADPRWQNLRETEWIQSHITAPIKLNGEVIGFLNVDSARANAFQEKHCGWVEAFADQAAIALNNARLFSNLAQERAQMQAILDASGESICYIEGTTIAYANKSFADLTGYPLDVIIGTPITAFWMDTERQDDLFFEMQESVLDGRIWREELALRCRDGSVVKTAFTVSAIGGAKHQPGQMVAVIRDISQEDQLRERQTRFIANVAHEMRTPLTSLTTRLFLMKRKPEDTPKHMQVIEEVAERMVQLVEDMKLFFEFERQDITLQPSPQHLQDMLAAGVEALQPRIQKRSLNVELNLPDEPIYVTGDATYTRRLLKTMIEYMVLNAAPETTIGATFHQNGNDQEAAIRFYSREHGVSTQDLEFIFDPFHYASVGGEVLTGLELPIAKHIIDLHQWTVRIDSSEEPALILDVVVDARLVNRQQDIAAA